MCGRFTLASPAQAVAAALGLPDFPVLSPRYNVAPSQAVAIVRGAPAPEVALARWGLVPGWTKDLARLPLLFNARAETAAEKPSFRAPLRNRRCVVPADGFYEWTGAPKARRAIYFTLADGAPFALAGLWDRWLAPDGSELESCTILTTAPNALLARYHDRMPAILPRERIAAWLDPELRDPARVAALIDSYPAEAMRERAVGPTVHNARNEGPGCVEPA
jgi:putative SOS response-associated peptidase YedK